MSQYGSSSESSLQGDNQQQYFKVFQHDYYLSASLPLIQQWKENINLALDHTTNQVDAFKYMQLEAVIFNKEENYLLAGYHVRFYAFAYYIDKALKQLIQRYKKAYRQQVPATKTIQELDQTINRLSFYIQKIQLSRASSYIEQIDEMIIRSVYQSMQKLFPMILSPYCIWRIVMFLQTMHQQEDFYVMNIHVNMSLEYYLKTFKTLKFKNESLTNISILINPLLEKGNYLQAYFLALKELGNLQLKHQQQNQEQQKQINQQLKCEFMCCLRYMHFVTFQPYNSHKDLYIEYIMSSLKFTYYGKNQNMPTEYYEKLFLRVLMEFRKDTRLIDLGLYIDPNIVGQRSKQSFGKVEEVVLKFCQQLTDAQQQFLSNKVNPKHDYVKKLLKDEQFTLLIQFLQTIMQFNKSAFLKADNQIYEIFLDMAEFLKNVFLSFGKDIWLFPQNVFTPLTLGFFKKISEDINDDLKNILYEMVQNLNQNKLPQKLIFQGQQFKLVQVTRLEYLSAIMYYIQDCSREQQYLNLPEIAPANFQTSVLLIKSLHVKLKHHEPNPTQLPLFSEYLKQCEKYKLKINFSWYKHQSFMSQSLERQVQFQIQSGLPCKEIRNIFRKCLNYRDRQYARKTIQQQFNQKHSLNPVELASMLKYNHGIQDLPEVQNVKQQELFLLLQQMNTMLAILPNDLFDLPLEEEINVSYLHLLLTFYCSKIKEAQGSEIYFMILQKVLINYLKSPFSRSKQFRRKYPKFFEQFIYQYHQMEICATLNELLIEFQDKYLPFPQNQNQQSPQQKAAVSDLKQKIEIIRDQFLDKLQGSEQQIAIFMVSFTSLISQTLPFSIFLQCVRLFVKLINKKPSLGQIASIKVFLSEPTYKQPKFFAYILSYLENYLTQDSTQKKQVKCYLIRHILKSPQILDIVTFKQLMELLSQAKKTLDVRQDTDEFLDFYGLMNQIAVQSPEKIRPDWILPYILFFYNKDLEENYLQSMFSQDNCESINNKVNKMQNFLNRLKKFDQDEWFWSQVRKNLKDFKFKEFYFLFQFYDDLKVKSIDKNTVTFKDIWLYFLKKLSDPSWTFHYMVKLNQPSLIDIHENRDDVLINLIKKQKLTKDSYPIFKNMISETKNMPFILHRIMQSYEQEENYAQNFQFHNKLILINERFPDPKIEENILRWIQVGQSKLPLKIPQSYYINFLKKQLKSLPQSVAYESILKVHQSPSQLSKLNKQIQNIFQILLYFPVKKFESICLSKMSGQKKMATQQQQQKSEQKDPQTLYLGEDQGQWEQQDQNQQVQIKKTQRAKQQEGKQVQEPAVDSEDSEDSQNKDQNPHQSHNNEGNSQDEYNHNYEEQDRPKMLQIFYEQQKREQLQKYRRLYRLRQQVDTYLKSDYSRLLQWPIVDDEYLRQKLVRLADQLSHVDQEIQKAVLLYLPQPLHRAIFQLGYKMQRDLVKIEELRKPKTKVFQLQGEMFSERGESDGSQDAEEEDYSSEGQSDHDVMNQDDDFYGQEQEHQAQLQTKVRKDKNNKTEEEDDDIQLPQLNAQFSKVQSQIKGNELDRKQLTKVLEVFLVQIFKLTPINFKKKQVIFSYVQIMQSDLSQTFFQSILTVLRMDQNHNKNRKSYLQQLKQSLTQKNPQSRIQQHSGLSQFSKYNGLVNFTYLLKVLKQKGKYLNDKTNPFRKQSETLLPIAQKCIIEFDLPIQTNIFSLVLLYIHSKPKIRQLLEEVSVQYSQYDVKMTKKQIKRIGEAFFKQKSHSSVWQYIQGAINYRVSDQDRLIISLDSYSQGVFKSLSSSGMRVKQTIQKNKQVFTNKMVSSQNQMKSDNLSHLKHYQRLYYITSNLLSSCSQEIKQFYFMNKNICRYLWDKDDQNQDNYYYNKIPKLLLNSKSQIHTNQSFVSLVQLAIRIIYFVKKQLYGKISPKKFNRLIHYPKLIIQTATLYMHISGQKGTKDNWQFKPKHIVQKFIQNYQMGQYQFKSLVEVYNLILGLLEIQGFCNGKFKELLIPYFTYKNKEIGLEAPLMFKVPQINEGVNGQSIFVTRECSFDMAFYQVKGQNLYVQFHGEQGSDHGGMIREFMMGWKGVGVGQQDFFIGKILGISFKQSVPYGGFIDLQMCIRITNFKVTLQTLEEIDKQIYSSLKYIKENDPVNLGLTFSVMKKNPKSFEIEVFDLKPLGSQIQVTEENKLEYLDLYLEKYYRLGRQDQLDQIAIGFYTVTSAAYASIFKPHELMQHLKGQQVCDVNVLKAHVKYVQGYTATSVIIKWLWEILQTYNQQQLNKFIQFLTGSPKLPIFNPNFEITVQRVFNVQYLPVAHTCFNTLDLPEYPTKDILEKKLLTAIFEGNDNFGIM